LECLWNPRRDLELAMPFASGSRVDPYEFGNIYLDQTGGGQLNYAILYNRTAGNTQFHPVSALSTGVLFVAGESIATNSVDSKYVGSQGAQVLNFCDGAIYSLTDPMLGTTQG